MSDPLWITQPALWFPGWERSLCGGSVPRNANLVPNLTPNIDLRPFRRERLPWVPPVRCADACGHLRLNAGLWKASGHWGELGAGARATRTIKPMHGGACRLGRSESGWTVTGLLD